MSAIALSLSPRPMRKVVALPSASVAFFSPGNLLAKSS